MLQPLANSRPREKLAKKVSLSNLAEVICEVELDERQDLGTYEWRPSAVWIIGGPRIGL